MAALEEKILSKVKKKPVFGGGILTIHFFYLKKKKKIAKRIYQEY